uniref:Putative secreted protein n=1 Tax=Ixodes ricinus TaxID=34613 RepID=A0A6B0TW71_IXORI
MPASISLSAFQRSWGASMPAAVWMVRFSWLVQTRRRGMAWRLMNLARATAYSLPLSERSASPPILP